MRVLVTGAGSGIGRATAAELALRGHEVVATARDKAVLADLEVAHRLRLDVTSDSSLAEVVGEIGSVDAVVNNAAFSIGGPIESVAIDQVREMFETNVIGPVRVLQAFLPAMRQQGSGVVVNVCSVAGHVAAPLGGFYAATKHALEAISEALYIEAGHFGIRVVIVEPGFIAPGMKHREASGHPPAYDELAEQISNIETTVLGGERPGPQIVATAIADAIDHEGGPLRRRVGTDAELILSTRATLDDDAYEAAMRSVVGLSW